MRRTDPSDRVNALSFKTICAIAIFTLLVGFNGPTVGAAGPLPLHNPKANVTPNSEVFSKVVCTNTPTGWNCANPCASTHTESFPVYTNNPACTSFMLQVIGAARKKEGLAPMVLPTNWFSLNAPEQLFVLADLERTARGLAPYLGINDALASAAQRAAQSGTDSSVAPGFAIGIDAQGAPGWGATWSTGFTTLEADYEWMYNDGWGGSRAATYNLGCTSATSSACWGHRDELLGFDGAYNPGVGLSCKDCEMGTGFADYHGQGSFTDLVELPAASAPPMTFTWAKNVAPYLSP